MVAGVCGGIAEYFNIDPTIVRLITVVLLFVTGFVPVGLAYIVMAVVVPDAPIAGSKPKTKLAGTPSKATKAKPGDKA